MESNHKTYSHLDTVERVDSILNESDTSFPEVNDIPSRDKLTYTNGYYVNCTALFVDMRKSSELPQKHKRPTLAKIYRSYISEMVAVMNGSALCREINIVGDCVSGIFNTPKKADIDAVFSVAAHLSSAINVINYKFEKRGIAQITVGVGMEYGRALMIKAGYNGSGINDVVWMGDVVNSASTLSSYGNKTYSDREIMVSSVIYGNLNEHNQGLLTYNSNRGCYHGDVIIPMIEDWLKQQREKDAEKQKN